MADFGLVESFGCDNGELDGQTPAQCFTLGYEFATVCHALSHHESGSRQLVHVENIERIIAAAKKRGRVVSFNYSPDDKSESWAEMSWVPVSVIDD